MEQRNRSYRAKTYNVECTVDGQEYNLYTCPDNCRTHMVLLFVVDVLGNVTVDVEWDRADGSHAHVLGSKNMTAGEYVQLSDGYIVLEPGDQVNVTVAGTTFHTDAFCTVEEYFLPNRPAQA